VKEIQIIKSYMIFDIETKKTKRFIPTNEIKIVPLNNPLDNNWNSLKILVTITKKTQYL